MSQSQSHHFTTVRNVVVRAQMVILPHHSQDYNNTAGWEALSYNKTAISLTILKSDLSFCFSNVITFTLQSALRLVIFTLKWYIEQCPEIFLFKNIYVMFDKLFWFSEYIYFSNVHYFSKVPYFSFINLWSCDYHA